MMTASDLFRAIDGLGHGELEDLVARGWIKPKRDDGAVYYLEIDVARIRLIRELRHDLAIDDNAMPVILSLIDQVHDLRRVVDRLAREVHETRGAAARPVRQVPLRRPPRPGS